MLKKGKIDVVIDGVTYKNVAVYYNYKDVPTIDTSGIASIIKQYIKNKYGNIKVWAKSRKFAGGSSVDVNLWKVPNEWWSDVLEFVKKFKKEHVFTKDGDPDGTWLSGNANAKTTNGKIVENVSPYISVENDAPWGTKEYDMTPPDYTKSLPKKERSTPKRYQKGSGKKRYEKKSEGWDLLTSRNGWDLYVTGEYTYRLIKQPKVKPVSREDFNAMKGDMLEVGMNWMFKDKVFQSRLITSKFSDEKIDEIFGVVAKYFGGSEEKKEESKSEEFNWREWAKENLVQQDVIAINHTDKGGGFEIKDPIITLNSLKEDTIMTDGLYKAYNTYGRSYMLEKDFNPSVKWIKLSGEGITSKYDGKYIPNKPKKEVPLLKWIHNALHKNYEDVTLPEAGSGYDKTFFEIYLENVCTTPKGDTEQIGINLNIRLDFNANNFGSYEKFKELFARKLPIDSPEARLKVMQNITNLEGVEEIPLEQFISDLEQLAELQEGEEKEMTMSFIKDLQLLQDI